MNNVIAVDASFSRTGVIYIDPEGKKRTKSISRPGNNYKIDSCLTHATSEALELKQFILKHNVKDVTVIYEYPAMASRSGAYLAVLMSKFDSLFRACMKKGVVKEIYYIPPTAVSGYTGILLTNKTAVVEFAQKIDDSLRMNHDVATALIMTEIMSKIKEGKYGKSFFKVTHEDLE